jgi:hypothetical protein
MLGFTIFCLFAYRNLTLNGLGGIYMKIKFNKDIRKILISANIIIILIFSYLIYNEAFNADFEEQKNTVYTYSNKGSINYSVYLKPNKLYNEKVLEEGRLYITEFVDYIDTNLKYEFTGEKSDNIKADYSITAKVQGYATESDKIINIWEKDFPILTNKTINSYENKILIDERVKVNLTDYNSFVKEIKDASKINCQTNLILSMNINLSGNTEKGEVEDSIITSLEIPLDVAMFEITGNNIVDKPGVIEETVHVHIPVNKVLVIIYGIILIALIISLITLLFFTQTAPEKDPLEKELNKIFKKHGDRLVALNSDMSVKNSIEVKSIEDLVKISDETGKPILYKYSEAYKEINKFYVSGNEEIFLLDLTFLDNPKQVDKTKDVVLENNNVQIKTESQLNI